MGYKKALHLQIVFADIEFFLHRRVLYTSDLEQYIFDHITFTDFIMEKQIII